MKRPTISDEQSNRLLEIIEDLEKKRGKPPCWLMVKQEIIRSDSPEFKNADGSSSLDWRTRAAFVRKNQIYVSKDHTFLSVAKYNEEYETYLERFERKYG
jgi:hypothetical protein